MIYGLVLIRRPYSNTPEFRFHCKHPTRRFLQGTGTIYFTMSGMRVSPSVVRTHSKNPCLSSGNSPQTPQR
ncbi:Hypothetical protein FKW44_010735 [Caligus rogercresseyi]|uniref:Uncharacterized protein n=1 Tax=Caligus rogercresseyi TaxID=217165 RepID=A0A7T8HHE7_CALRO|nr:Hypothetical protein FKW44_010735 [Caligus rogercresseyi]